MIKKSKGADIDGLVKLIMKGNDDIHVVVGPWSWLPADRGNGAKDWYFFVSVSKKGQWYSAKIDDPDYQPPGAGPTFWLPRRCSRPRGVVQISRLDARSMLKAALVQQKPVVIHDFDDELAMAKFCENIWPGPRISKVRKAIEQERAQWASKVS